MINNRKKAGLLLFFFCVCGGIWLITRISMKEKKQNVLVIDGTVIKDFKIRIYELGGHVHADLPIVAVLNALGCSLEWSSKDNATFETNGEEYILSLSEKKLFLQNNPKVNLLLPPPGESSFVCDREGDDLMTDDRTLWSTLYHLGLPVDIHIDDNKYTVYITTQYGYYAQSA